MMYKADIHCVSGAGGMYWTAESKVLNGCAGQGNSYDEAVRELEENEKVWLDTAPKFGIPIPCIQKTH